MSRKIIHIDMDCFYAAVEIKFRPHLRGQPVAVGGSPEGRGGVLTTANYEARQFGVRSAMTSAKALKLCPNLILISPDFSKYKVESRKVRTVLERYATLIEPLSLDEAYIDVTGSDFEGGSATRIAEKIRREIFEETGLTASAGVAPNKFLAKIASDLNKPNGLSVIRPADVEAFMKNLPVTKIWGVGRVTAEKMNRLGLKTCGDLQNYSVSRLIELFGSWGPQLFDFARGIDERPVRNDRERKSLTVEETYGRSLMTRKEALEALPGLYSEFLERLEKYSAAFSRHQAESPVGAPSVPPTGEAAGSARLSSVPSIDVAAAGVAARSVVVKVKFDNFRQKGRERKWESAAVPSLAVFLDLLEEALDGETLGIRLLGLGVRFASKTSDSRSGAVSQLPLI